MNNEIEIVPVTTWHRHAFPTGCLIETPDAFNAASYGKNGQILPGRTDLKPVSILDPLLFIQLPTTAVKPVDLNLYSAAGSHEIPGTHCPAGDASIFQVSTAEYRLNLFVTGKNRQITFTAAAAQSSTWPAIVTTDHPI